MGLMSKGGNKLVIIQYNKCYKYIRMQLEINKLVHK